MYSSEIFADELHNITQEQLILSENIQKLLDSVAENSSEINKNKLKKLGKQYQNLSQYTEMLSDNYLRLSQLFRHIILVDEQLGNK